MSRSTLSCLVCFVIATGGLHAGETEASAGSPKVAPNTWVKASIDWKATLSAFSADARWVQTDGYSDNTFRTKTNEVIIRTGIHSKSMGWSPGFYTNTSVAWDPRTDKAKVVGVSNWGGGSYGHGKLLPPFKEHATPSPRHTYDGITYIPEEDVMYMMLGANWRCGGRGANEEAKAQLKLDNASTWKYSFKTNRWTRIDHNVWKFFKCSPYETHLQYWPEGRKLIFFDSNAKHYAEFDLKTEKWAVVKTANKSPMRLYNARSAWDSKRSLWVFRLGPNLATFDPKTRTFKKLPDCWKLPPPPSKKELKEKKLKRDPRYAWKGVLYIPKHDAYLVTGPHGNDTRVFPVEKGAWEHLKGGEIKLVNGYLQYDPASDQVLMNYQLNCFRLRYVPDAKELSEAPR